MNAERKKIVIVLEMPDGQEQRLTFEEDRLRGAQIKEAAHLPLETEILVRRTTGLENVRNHEFLDLHEGEHIVVAKGETHINICVKPPEGEARRRDMHDPIVTGRQIKEAADASLEYGLQDGKQLFVKDDQQVDITKEQTFALLFHYKVNGEDQWTAERDLTPEKILKNAGIAPEEYYLDEIIGNKRESFKNRPTETIRMHNGMVFIAVVVRRTVRIYVNTEEYHVDQGQLTFQQIVKLAFPDKAGNVDILFKVSYRLGRGHNELKTLAEGGEVEAQEGMIFNVSYENRS